MGTLTRVHFSICLSHLSILERHAGTAWEQESKTRLVDALNGWFLDCLIDQIGGGRVSCGGNTNEGPLLYLSLALVNIRRINAPYHSRSHTVKRT